MVSLLQSIDSFKLLQEVNKQAEKHQRIIRVLLEIHIADEEAKHGFTPEECLKLVDSPELASLQHIEICGLMGMATFTDDQKQLVCEFKALHKLFTTLQSTRFADQPSFSILSMGMSQDYPLAIQEGSTMIRVGTDIFGDRTY